MTQMDKQSIVFSGEMRLYSWSDTSRSGPRITFDLAEASDIEKFKLLTIAKGGNTGHRLAVVMVEIGDDEQPVLQPEPAPVQRPGMLCILACTFCADPQFWQWSNCRNEADTKAWLLGVCGIRSRKELDTNKIAATRFHTLIREPYMAWRAAA